MRFPMLTFAALSLLLVLPLAAESGPNYDCDRTLNQCQAGCDEQAGTGKNANAYDRCLEACQKSHKSCTERQENASACAETFQECIREAGDDEKAMEGCRSSYRSCKGH